MQCRTHPERNGVNTCHQCGDWLCEECTVEINGRIFCRKCLAQLAGTPVPPPPAPAEPYPPHVRFRAPVYRGRHISGGILALLTIFLPIPGVNYMYEGLIKRGLAAMGGFFFLIYGLSVFSFWPLSMIFGLSLPIYWLTCLFDAIRIRRQLNAGETVNDDINDMLSFVKTNKNLILGVILALVAMSVIGSAVSFLAYPLRRLLPFLVIGFGLYVLFGRKSGRRHRGDKPDDGHDGRQM